MPAFEQLVESTGLDDALIEASKEAMKGYSSDVVKGVLAGTIAPLFATMAGDALGVFCGALLGTLLKRIIGLEDALNSKVNKLIQAPLRTGVGKIQWVIDIPAGSLDQIVFRETQLHQAIHEFDKALSMLDNVPSTEGERGLILLLQGMCAREIRGGQAAALSRFTPAASFCESAAARLLKKADDHRENAFRTPIVTKRTPEFVAKTLLKITDLDPNALSESRTFVEACRRSLELNFDENKFLRMAIVGGSRGDSIFRLASQFLANEAIGRRDLVTAVLWIEPLLQRRSLLLLLARTVIEGARFAPNGQTWLIAQG